MCTDYYIHTNRYEEKQVLPQGSGPQESLHVLFCISSSAESSVTCVTYQIAKPHLNAVYQSLPERSNKQARIFLGPPGGNACSTAERA